MSDLAIDDVPPPAEVFKRLSVLEKQSSNRVAELEGQIATLKAEINVLRVQPTTPVFDLPCFDKYRLPDGRVLTSTAVSKTTEWYELTLLVPHEAIRRDLIEVDYLLKEHVKPTEPWKLTNFFEWFSSRFFKMIHSHHDNEEKIFFPDIKKRFPNFPDKTSADHKTLLKMLDDICNLGKTFKELSGKDIHNMEASAKVLPELQKLWSHMVADMLPHLAEEEEQMVTFIKNVYTKKEMDALVQKIIQSEGLGASRLFLPSILESAAMWMTPANRNELKGELPPPIQFILRVFWTKPYQKYHRGALNSLRAGHPQVLIKERKGWF